MPDAGSGKNVMEVLDRSVHLRRFLGAGADEHQMEVIVETGIIAGIDSVVICSIFNSIPF